MDLLLSTLLLVVVLFCLRECFRQYRSKDYFSEWASGAPALFTGIPSLAIGYSLSLLLKYIGLSNTIATQIIMIFSLVVIVGANVLLSKNAQRK